MTQWRNVLLDHQAVSLVFSSESFIEPAAKALLAFSQRMGGFDWLAGIMNVGRDSFYPSANLWIDLRALINSFIPGGIINPADDYVEISKLLPHLLRGSGLDIRLGGHGELMGGLGMAYIYFGELFGPLFFFFWVWGCIAFIKSSMHVVVKMFMIHFFLLVTFIGGGFSTMFFHMANIFYLSLLLYVLDLVSFPFFQSMCHVKGQGSSQL